MKRKPLVLLSTILLLASIAILSLQGEAVADTYEWVGLGSGEVHSLAWTGTNLYTADMDNHIYRYDGATTWTNVGNPGTQSAQSLLWNSTSLFAGYGNDHVYRYGGGTSWTDLGSTGGDEVPCLAWNGSNVYAGSRDGHVYRYNSGTSWTDAGNLAGSIVHALLWNSPDLYAASANGHVYRYDGGTTWTDIGDTGGTQVHSLAWNGANVFAGCSNSHIYRYDGGTTWTDMGSTAMATVNSLIWNGSNLYAASDSGHVYRHDGGTTWTDLGDSGAGTVYALAWNDANVYAGGSSAHVYRYDGGGTWTDTRPTGDSAVRCLAWTGANLYAGSFNGHIYHYEGGTNWSDAGNPGQDDIEYLEWAGTALFAGCDNGHVYRYDGGTAWTDTGNPGSSSVRALKWNNSNLYAGCLSGFVYRYDGGTTWTMVGSPNDSPVLCLGWQGTHLFAGCSNGYVCRYDGGSTWTSVGNPGGSSTQLLVYNGTDFLASCAWGFVYRYDGNVSWTSLGRPGSDTVYGLAWAGTDLYAGSYDGNVERYEGGTSWTDTWPGMGPSIWSLSWTGTDLYAGTGPGVYRNASIGMHTVNASAPGGGHGTVSPATQQVADGGTATVNIAPDGGYQAASITDNGSPVSISNPYVINNVTADHNVVVTFSSTSSTWYLAEGTTAWGFDTYISIMNPNTSALTADITYMLKGGATETQDVPLPANSQTTVNPRDTVGDADFSTRVVSSDLTKPIAVDRTMTWTGGAGKSGKGTGTEAHSSVGVNSASDTWYMPEGSTSWGFETWLCIQNPNSGKATCQVTYMIEGEGPRAFTKEVGGNSRETYNMQEDIGQKDASIEVTSNIPVIPERSMYRNARREGHESIGTTTSATSYYLAEGTTDYGFTSYVCIQNPNDSGVSVNLTYMTPAGPVPHPGNPVPMEANSRKTVRVNDVLPDTDFSTRVDCSSPVIAERAMYWDNGTGEACHDSIGMSSPHMTFYLPDGQSSEGRETYVCVQNPNAGAVSVTLTYLRAGGGSPVVRNESIPGNSRQTYNMLEHSGLTGRASVKVVSNTSGKNIMVERAMYWNSRGAGTDTIGGCE